MNKNYLYSLATLIITIVALLGVAMYNGFPMVTSDTGVYINDGYYNVVPGDRPMFYSRFLQYVSCATNLWYVVIVQAIIIAYLMVQLVQKCLPKMHQLLHVFVCLATIVCTSAAWFVGQLMPDIFTASLMLSALLFLLEKNKWQSSLYLLLFFVSAIMHNANLATALICSFVLLTLQLIKPQIQLSIQRCLVLFVVAMVSFIPILISNKIAGNGWVVAKQSHVFIMGRLVESGVLKKYLQATATTKPNVLTPYTNELPQFAWQFVWDDNGPFRKTGGWDSSKNNYTAIIKDVLTNKKYLGMWLLQNTKDAGKQWLSTNTGDGLQSALQGSNVYGKIEEFYLAQLQDYINDRQNTNALPYAKVNGFYQLCFILLLLAGAVLVHMINNKTMLYCWYATLLFTIVNAFITVSFANVLARLNARCIWLLPLLSIGIIVQWMYEKYAVKNDRTISY
jgi:hypothetical protein